MMKKALSIFSKAKPSPAQALEGLKMFTEAVQTNHKIREEEQTKRTQINAYKEVEIEKIQAQKEILEKYLQGIFSERRGMIEKMFDTLDKGIENNNLELIQMSMGAIVSIAQESPLKQVEALVKDFNDNDVKSITI